MDNSEDCRLRTPEQSTQTDGGASPIGRAGAPHDTRPQDKDLIALGDTQNNESLVLPNNGVVEQINFNTEQKNRIAMNASLAREAYGCLVESCNDIDDRYKDIIKRYSDIIKACNEVEEGIGHLIRGYEDIDEQLRHMFKIHKDIEEEYKFITEKRLLIEKCTCGFLLLLFWLWMVNDRV